jgi:tetratricopeptide (TPR) repeat protein
MTTSERTYGEMRDVISTLPPVPEFLDREIAALLCGMASAHGEDPTVIANLEARVAELARASSEAGHRRGQLWAVALRAMLHRGAGRYAPATEGWQAILEPAREIGDVPLEAACLHGLAVMARIRQDYDRAFELLLRELALRHRLGDELGEQQVYNSLALTHAHLGHYAGALDHYRRSLQLATSRGDAAAESLVRANLGGLMIELGDGAGL